MFKIPNLNELDLELTGHLNTLQIAQVLDCHLKDISFLQFRVSGAL